MIYKIKNTFFEVINYVKEYDDIIKGRFSQFEINNNVKADNYIKFNENNIEIKINNRQKKLNGRIIKTDIYPIINNCISYIINDVQNMFMHAVVVSKGENGILILGNFGQGKTTLAKEFVKNGFELNSTDQTWVRIKNNYLYNELGSTFDIVEGKIEYNNNFNKKVKITKIIRIVGLCNKGDTNIIINNNKFYNIKNLAQFCNWNYTMPIFTDDIELYNTNIYVKQFLNNLTDLSLDILDVRGNKEEIYNKVGDGI